MTTTRTTTSPGDINSPEEVLKRFTVSEEYVRSIKPLFNRVVIRIARNFEDNFYQLASGLVLTTDWKPSEYAHVDGEVLAVGQLRYKPLKKENMLSDGSMPLEYDVDKCVIEPGDRVFMLNTAIMDSVAMGLYWSIEGGGFAALVRYDLIVGAVRDGKPFGVNGHILMEKIRIREQQVVDLSVGGDVTQEFMKEISKERFHQKLDSKLIQKIKSDNDGMGKLVGMDQQFYTDAYKVVGLPRDIIRNYGWNPTAKDREDYIHIGQTLLVETCWPLQNTYVRDNSFDFVVCRQEHVAGMLMKGKAEGIVLNSKRILYQAVIRKLTDQDGLIMTTEMGGRYVRGFVVNVGPDTHAMDVSPENKAHWRGRLIKRGDEVLLSKGARGMQFGKIAMIVHEKDIKFICSAKQIAV